MKAQGLISDIVLNVRRGKQHFTFHELLGMTQESNPDLTWEQFEGAIRLLIRRGELVCSVPVHSSLVDIAIFKPGSPL